MNTLKPWARGPFEQILHAEMHMQNGNDFDRRIALISYDNAIEVSITTYLTLNPIQRNGIQYRKEDVNSWLHGYHTKIKFFIDELQRRSLPVQYEKSIIIWYHDIRNEQYHGGTRGIPETHVLDGIRKAALWVFSILFDVPNAEQILENQVAYNLAKEAKPERNLQIDRAIDGEYGMVQVIDQEYYTSELLFGVDPVAYQDAGMRLCLGGSKPEDTDDNNAEQ
jgi:hypothetical protein